MYEGFYNLMQGLPSHQLDAKYKYINFCFNWYYYFDSEIISKKKLLNFVHFLGKMHLRYYGKCNIFMFFACPIPTFFRLNLKYLEK